VCDADPPTRTFGPFDGSTLGERVGQTSEGEEIVKEATPSYKAPQTCTRTTCAIKSIVQEAREEKRLWRILMVHFERQTERQRETDVATVMHSCFSENK